MSQSKVTNIDRKRMRPGMRHLAQRIVLKVSSPINSGLWNSLPLDDPNRITSRELIGTIGAETKLWKLSDEDASDQIIHLTLLTMQAIHTEQFNDRDLLATCMEAQSAAEKVKSAIAQKLEVYAKTAN